MTSIIKKSNAKMCIVADVTVAYQNMSKIGVKTVSHVGVKMCRCNTPTCATGKTDIYDTFITEDRKNEKKCDMRKIYEEICNNLCQIYL